MARPFQPGDSTSAALPVCLHLQKGIPEAHVGLDPLSTLEARRSPVLAQVCATGHLSNVYHSLLVSCTTPPYPVCRMTSSNWITQGLTSVRLLTLHC